VGGVHLAWLHTKSHILHANIDQILVNYMVCWIIK